MDDVLRDLAAVKGGYLHRCDLLARGFSDKAIARAVRGQELKRIRVGTYVLPETFDDLAPEEKHVVLARSVVDKFELGSVALSHHSAAAMAGMATYGVRLGIVHLTRLDGGAGRTEAGVVHHKGNLRADEVQLIDGRLVVEPPRAMWETACSGTQRGALVVMDSALHQQRVTTEEIADVSGRFTAWRGARAARLVARIADGGAANPGESLFRLVCLEAGLPKPQTQVPIRSGDGELIGIVDTGWLEHSHVGEFDGIRKYLRDLHPDDDPSAVVVREKIREDRLRSLRLGVSRSTWTEVQPQTARRTGQRIAHEFEQSFRLYSRGRRHIA